MWPPCHAVRLSLGIDGRLLARSLEGSSTLNSAPRFGEELSNFASGQRPVVNPNVGNFAAEVIGLAETDAQGLIGRNIIIASIKRGRFRNQFAIDVEL